MNFMEWIDVGSSKITIVLRVVGATAKPVMHSIKQMVGSPKVAQNVNKLKFIIKLCTMATGSCRGHDHVD